MSKRPNRKVKENLIFGIIKCPFVHNDQEAAKTKKYMCVCALNKGMARKRMSKILEEELINAEKYK